MPTDGFSQKKKAIEDGEEESSVNKSWSFGINTGVAFANKYHANFYNGSEGNQNEISYVLDNYYWNQEIQQAVNDTFTLYGLPTDMKYKPAFCVGFVIKKKFNNHIGVFGQFNFSKFKTSDFFTIKIGSTPTSQAYPNLMNCPIWGEEDRINIDLGMSYDFYIDDKISFFLEGGFNLNNTRVKEHMIQIEPIPPYSLINIYGDSTYVPGTVMNENYVHEGGIGIGAFLSPGLEFRFNETTAVDLLASVYYSRINLMYYDTYRPYFNIVLRFVFSTRVSVVY